MLSFSPLIGFRPHFRIEIIEPDQVVLFSEDTHFLLQGEFYVTLTRILKVKPASRLDIIEMFKKEFSKEFIHKGIQKLISKGFIGEIDEDTPKNIASFW